MLVAADLQRPAAVDQIKILGEQLNVQVYSEGSAVAGQKGPSPIDVCRNAVAHAKKTLLDTVILDTAGRLHIAEMPMDELKQIDRLVKPDDVLFVCDAMTGQDAVNSAKAFNDALDLNGVILTKLDGDARGGAALSIRKSPRCPSSSAASARRWRRSIPSCPSGWPKGSWARATWWGSSRRSSACSRN